MQKYHSCLRQKESYLRHYANSSVPVFFNSNSFPSVMTKSLTYGTLRFGRGHFFHGRHLKRRESASPLPGSKNSRHKTAVITIEILEESNFIQYL